jgi:hypothetical protein
MLVVGGVSLAQNKEPVRNVSGARHPHIAAAQAAAQNAYNKVVQAQEANEWDLKGHAQKAKQLLEEVNNELKLAAEASNARAK